MKKLILLTALLITVFFSYAQFGGGTGTEIDPYRIYTKNHFEEFADSVFQGHDFTGEHLKLMGNIDDSLTLPVEGAFNGYFHGQGYYITLALDYSYHSLFSTIDSEGTLDSLSVKGYIYAVRGIVRDNYGTIFHVINSLTVPYTQQEFSQYVELLGGDIYGAGICYYNFGSIVNCINYCEIHGNHLGGICNSSYGNVVNCINKGLLIFHNEQFQCSGGGIVNNTGDLSLVLSCNNNASFVFLGNSGAWRMGGIVGANEAGIISKCTNNGNISGKVSTLGGIVGGSSQGKILNCANFGSINGEEYIGGICGFYFDFDVMQNCFNIGTVNGVSMVGGINGYSGLDTVRNCLNIGRTNGSAIIDSVYNSGFEFTIAENNYYDKQMCLNKGISDADVPNSAEGKLTIQLIGTSPELQAMLGDGWSYAEGRYPIPLGLENDSMALVAATPVYLHFKTEEDYNHVDSVTKNFTVGLENNVTWDEANGKVSFSGENVTLLNIGMETLTVNLGEYSKKVRINILDTETSNILESTIEKGIIIYPNPASDYININLYGINADKIEICDITGKAISSQIIAKENNPIHIGNIKPGMYLLKIYNKNQNVTTLRFVKN